jgi:hypothetical protein
MIYSEDKHINGLIDKSKAKAAAMRKLEVKSMEDLIWSLRMWWCRYYKRPLKDPLLESYDINELLFEFFLLSDVDEAQETNKIISDNREELEDLFKDMPSLEDAEPSQDEQSFLAKEWSMSEEDFTKKG